MELLKFSSMARRLTSHGSGKQVRMCVLHFTCIPIGIFIQLRQQLGMYFLEDAGRQSGWEKVASLLWEGLWRWGPKPRTPKFECEPACGNGLCDSHSPGPSHHPGSWIEGNTTFPLKTVSSVFKSSLDWALILQHCWEQSDQCWVIATFIAGTDFLTFFKKIIVYSGM